MPAEKKAYAVNDLGPGDGGKGGVVHRIATLRRAHTIVKKGGAQGSHGVCTAAGQKFAFSQWGCGTFEGIRTHLGTGIVTSPIGILNEAQSLRDECGLRDPFDLLTMDEEALCATPYHGISSRLKELALKTQARGTIGTGVGECYRYNERLPHLSLFAKDLARTGLRERLAAVRDQIRKDLAPVIAGGFLEADQAEADREIELLYDDGFLNYVLVRFREVARLTTIVDPHYFERVILARNGVIVVESSHGVLTDKFQGLHPHTSAIRTLPGLTKAMLTNAGYDGQIVSLGIHRGYEIRHGAGPMPTTDLAMGERLLPGSNKDENRYQGRVRVGPLDLVLMRYAIAASGGPQAFDALAITWFDQVAKNGEWKVCNSYREGATDPNFFTTTGDIKLRVGEDDAQLAHQAALGEQLTHCVPMIDSFPIAANATQDELFDLCATTLGETLHVPVRMLSLGPTEADKVLR